MAFPLLPFIAGAAVGSLVAYVYKDDASHKALRKSGRRVVRLYQEGEKSVRGLLGGKVRERKVTAGGSDAETPSPSKGKTATRPRRQAAAKAKSTKAKSTKTGASSSSGATKPRTTTARKSSTKASSSS